MNDVQAQLEGITRRAREGKDAPMSAMEAAARRAAAAVRADALRSGRSVNIRVLNGSDHVSVALAGPHAAIYREPVQRALEGASRELESAVSMKTAVKR